MEVILLERVEKLGQMGDVVSVKPGFARNYLLPSGKALRATNENKAQFEQQRVQLEAENLKRKEEAEAVAAKMEDIKIVLIRQAGDAGQLYGSVTGRDIAEAITAAGATVARGQVELPTPIKTVGLHSIRIVLHGEVSVTVKVNVARSEDEAETQEKTGAAALSLAQQEQEEIRAEAEAAAAAAEAVVEQAEEMFDEEAAGDAVADATAEAEAAQEAEEEAPAPAAEEAGEDAGDAEEDKPAS